MKFTDKTRKITLLIGNVILVMTVVIAVVLYSGYVRRMQDYSKKIDFITTVESMKQVSMNYLNSERGYVRNWATYISEHDMTLDEAMEFLKSINTDSERLAHIIDMDTFEAYTSYYPAKNQKIDTYTKYLGDTMTETEQDFRSTMLAMFNDEDDRFLLLGKYQIDETHARVVSVGKRVTIKTEQGYKDYLLLRIIPTDVLKKTWVFPMEYKSAEVGIITREGDYVVQSNSMKSGNFREYIRAYNFQDDYNKVDEFKSTLMNTEKGTLIYKNFRGKECLWYYSSFGDDSSLDILACVETEELKSTVDAWLIVFVACGTLTLLMVIDGLHLFNVNRKLRETVKLAEQASEAKTQFLAAMSHDIRTPLNAVIGMTTIAKNNADNPDYVKQCLDKTLKAGRQLLTLINDVLDISKIESGKLSLSPEEVELEKIVSDLLDIQEPLIKEKNISVTCDIDSLPYKYVYVDRLRLSQIFSNLLSNAVKYTDTGGRVRIRMHEEKAGDDSTKTELVFCISDNGIGMTEDFQKNMYSLFSREVSTQVNRTQGSGLGLSIVRQLVDLMNGDIKCDSVQGEGTTFVVRLKLPIVDKCYEETKDITDDVTDFGNLHILVAEDNELNWEIIQILLSEQGISSDRAENGQICVDMLKAAPVGTYDAVFMDIQMPVMNGLTAARMIRALDDARKREIPIIAMTADAFAENVQECFACGMNGHIAKPIDMNTLMNYLVKIKNGAWK